LANAVSQPALRTERHTVLSLSLEALTANHTVPLVKFKLRSVALGVTETIPNVIRYTHLHTHFVLLDEGRFTHQAVTIIEAPLLGIAFIVANTVSDTLFLTQKMALHSHLLIARIAHYAVA
jgi:hypothetical protein